MTDTVDDEPMSLEEAVSVVTVWYEMGGWHRAELFRQIEARPALAATLRSIVQEAPDA